MNKIKFIVSFIVIFLLTTKVVFSQPSSVFYFDDPRVTSEAKWSAQHVGLGVQVQLKQLLLDEIFDIELYDEKSLFTKNKQLTHQIFNLEQSHNINFLKEKATAFKLEKIYWVRIIDFLKPQTKVHISLFSFGSDGTEIELEVCRYSLSMHAINCYSGEAESSKQAMAFIYKPIEGDNFAKAFNQTEAGKLTKIAIKNALNDMLLE